MVSDAFLSSVLQSSYPFLLPAIRLHDHGFSLGDVPASRQSGVDDYNHHQGDDNSSESGVGAQRLKIEIFLALYCVA